MDKNKLDFAIYIPIAIIFLLFTSFAIYTDITKKDLIGLAIIIPIAIMGYIAFTGLFIKKFKERRKLDEK